MKEIKKLALIFSLLSFVVLSFGLNRPFTGQHDWNSVMYAKIARNHLRYGLLETKLAMVTNVGPLTPGDLGYFTHYPPLMPLLVALSFWVFGVTEWAARLVPVLSAAVMIYFVFLLVAERWHRTAAVFTAIFLTFAPMLIYYSKIPVHETVVLGFIAAAIWSYGQWLNTGKEKYYWYTLLVVAMAQATSWSGYYLSLYLPIHALFFAKEQARQSFGKLTLLFLLAPLMFLLHNLHMFWLVGPRITQDLVRAVSFRLNLGPEAAKYGFTYGKFFEFQARWIVVYFTRVMTFLSLTWVLWFMLKRLKKQKVSQRESFILLLFVFGFTHNAIFRNLAYIHDYMLIYALPFFAVSAGVMLAEILRYLRFKKEIIATIALVVLVLFATERINYLQALFRSGERNPAYQFSLDLNQLTDPEDQIFITSHEFRNFYDVFIDYYADRRHSTDVKLPEDLSDYDYVAIPKSHDYVSAADKERLYKNYEVEETSSGFFFKVQ